MAIYENILHTVGRTPVVRINRLGPHGIDLYAKIEAFNPMGSVKDRIAVAIIEDAERNGQLRPGQTVIEATSGNTGIALAMVCAQKGYPLVVTMAENFSIERRRLMRFLGARVVLTPAAQKGSGMLRKAMELAARHDWFLCRQFENNANAEAHIQTTAAEILDDFEGARLDYVVTGSGTGGTVNGIARALKARRPETKIVLCEPANSPTIASFVADPALTGSVEESHPAFRPHPIQGWSPDFIPKLALDALRAGLIDTIMPVEGVDSLTCSRELARKEGIFCGISAGATLAGALEVARAAQAGSAILCLLPDTGERYQSTPLFDGIDADMTDEELEISDSTPSACFLPPAVVGKPAAAATYLPTQAAVDFVEATVSGPRTPVVMFALQWCEFSWSMRKFLIAHGIELRSIELDAAEFPMRHESTAIRNALRQRTGSTTIPQLFVAGKYVGGCTDAFDAWNEGRLKNLLRSAGVHFTASGADPYGFLPRWTQSRKRSRRAAV